MEPFMVFGEANLPSWELSWPFRDQSTWGNLMVILGWSTVFLTAALIV